MLDQLQASIATVADAVGDSVVHIRAGGPRGPRTAGVVLAADRVLTNAHGVPDEGEVQVRFADGEQARATVLARDLDGDLAVLEVATGERPAVAWADEAPVLGTPVVTLVPTRHGLRATFGTVSATGRGFRGPGGHPITDGVEHTAPLARGSSGSPLLNLQGRLVGLNTHRVEPFYLAVPVGPRLRARADLLGRGEVPERRRLGVAVAPRHVAARLRAAVGLPPRDGVLVHEVEPDGPAAAAGIEAGDLLVSADGTALHGPDDLHAALTDADGTLSLVAVRGESEREVAVDLG